MRRLATLLGALLVLLGAALWLGPRVVDWEAQRPRLAALAAARLGRPVALEGPLRLALLPQPRVEASGVRIGGDEEDGLGVAARAMRLRLDLGALLAGRLEPREIVLVGAEIRLPWPPATTLALRPPPWLLALDARIEEGRVHLGEAVLEGVAARLTAGDALEAVHAEGAFTWRGLPVRFAATLGRPGFDGVATLDLTLAAANATAAARGALLPEGGFEGRMEVSGADLAALLPAPHGPFRATGRLTAGADLLAAEDLVLDLAGAPARGAAALRVAPAPRLDIALTAGRVDLDAWIGALRAAPAAPAMPLSLDLSAEAAGFRGLALRRLRGAAFLEGERLTLTDVSALLPGETEVELAGATAGARLELGLRFAGKALRETLAALGLPLPAGTDPARLREGEGRLRLVLEEGQVAVPELAATIDGARVSGAGVLRLGGGGAARPALGLGLTFDRLDLDGLVPEAPDWAGLATAGNGGRLGGIDANLRLAAEALRWRGAAMERAALDAALENGRLTVRRLSGRIEGADIALSGALHPGPAPRFADLMLELNAGGGIGGLAALLPGEWPDRSGLAALPVAMRLSGGGPAEALALRTEGEIGELRVEASGTLDLPGGRGTGALTLRHPGAPRLLGQALGADRRADWLGEGSLSLVATLGASRAGVTAESFDLVAGALRARGQLALGLGGVRPRLTGRVAAERLPLPELRWRAAEPLVPDRLLGGFDAELALEAARLEAPGAPALEAVAATLRLAAGTLRVEGLRARLGGGVLEGVLALDAAAETPHLAAELRVTDAAVAGPLLDLPLDLSAGHVEAEARLEAAGHSPAAMQATLSGEVRLQARDGVLVGFDLAALAAAAEGAGSGEAAEAAIRRALAGGATAFERLDLAARLADGRATLVTARLVGEGGLTATATGELDLPRNTLDLQVNARPGTGEGPDLGLRLTGPVNDPRRLPEIAAWARWRAERG